MKKINAVFALIMVVVLLGGCVAGEMYPSAVVRSDTEIVQMKVEDKTVDITYVSSYDEHYNIELSYKGSKYIIKNRIIFNNVKALDSVDVLYVINYDADNNIVSAFIKPITQKD